MSRPLIITEPTPDHLQAFLASWPPGIGRLETTEGDVFGLLMRRGPDVVWCRAGLFDAVDEPFVLADQVASTVLRALAEPRERALGAAAFVVGSEGSERVGIAVFCFDETSENQPGAGGAAAGDALVSDLSAQVGVAVSPLEPRPYDTIGTYRLEGIASPVGLLFVGRVIPADDDPAWSAWTGDETVVHLPSVGFAEEGSPDDA